MTVRHLKQFKRENQQPDTAKTKNRYMTGSKSTFSFVKLDTKMYYDIMQCLKL